ncbi:DUF6765 family protein [Candidatus Magnetominusculus dajiuhuensis]|uniref:DUF6765 family protein n=1 Tax=Candidatus Magnetominusculus dajiuhuensis TaxID=3137712 RepID=UPI003B428F03
MEKDFHYDIIYSIAKLTKFMNPEIIAYASQFVDDNNERWLGDDIPFPEKIPYPTGGHYFPIMTQSMSVLSVDPYIQKFVYIPFHFLPGDDAALTIGGMTNTLSTTPNSSNAQFLLNNALASMNPYKVGIALHTFADTWSHQNFTGMQEDWNVVDTHNLKKYVIPAIGHAQAAHSPDVISETWTDHRLGRQIVNADRALDAIEKIYTAMRSITNAGTNWAAIQPRYEAIVRASDFNSRTAAVAKLVADECNNEAVPAYDRNAWVGAVLQRSGLSIEFKPGVTLKNTNWYQFNQAAKEQLSIVLGLIKDL